LPVDGEAGRRLQTLAGAARNTRVSPPGEIEDVYRWVSGGPATIGDYNAVFGIGGYLIGPGKPFVRAKFAAASNRIDDNVATRRRSS
jgi:hypothetical protein